MYIFIVQLKMIILENQSILGMAKIKGAWTILMI